MVSRVFPVALARGKHLFPFRTEQLSPSAPMVLGSQGPGRVGRRRFFQQAMGRLRAARLLLGDFSRGQGAGGWSPDQGWQVALWGVSAVTGASTHAPATLWASGGAGTWFTGHRHACLGSGGRPGRPGLERLRSAARCG